jgi:sugar lactone lactonase YvrE
MVLARVIGQTSLALKSTEPNLVEGRELNGPQGVAIDTSVSPPIVYVSDTFNNRVLAWRDASAFQNGAPADAVIGQLDMFSTDPQGPANDVQFGLWRPVGLAVDAQGNLYVVDARNNRILRYPKPFAQADPVKVPDQVIGQPSFSTFAAGTTATSLRLSFSSASLCTAEPDHVCAQRAAMAFDAAGNLWVTDAGNHRVLRFPADANGRIQGTADMVLGQSDFTTATTTTDPSLLGRMNTPAGLAFDRGGRLLVADAMHRVLVFIPNFFSGQTATRVIGGVYGTQGRALNPPTARSLNTPGGVRALANGEILVVDMGNNRVLRFPAYEFWSSDLNSSPPATVVIGQPDLVSNASAAGASGLSVPVDVAVAGDDFFIVDSSNSRVIVFPQGSTTASRVLGQTGFDYIAPNLVEGRELFMAFYRLSPAESGDPRKLLSWAGALVVDTRSVPRLYIADSFNHRVLGYCDARKAKAGDTADLVIGQPDFFRTQANGGATTPNDQTLYAPTALALDANGNLFVADAANARVLRFAAPCDQPSGQQSFPHANLVLGQADFTSPPVTFASPRNMFRPSGLALTPEGYLAVSDAALNRVLMFKKPDGGDFSSGMDAATVFGQPNFFGSDPGNGLNQLNGPQQIAMDAAARLYVCDYSNNRVLIFTDSAHAASNSSAVLAITNINSSSSLVGPRAVYINQTTGEAWISSPNYLGVFRYPSFENLSISSLANGAVVTGVIPLAAVLDARGNLVVAEAANRIGIYSPRVTAVDGAAFLASRALTPGVIATLYAPYQAAPTWADVIPLPRELAGLQVLVNGVPSPLFYVGDSQYPGFVQINLQVPMSAPATGTIEILVVEAATQAPVGAA